MARHIEITHTYVVKIPSNNQEAIGELAKVAVGIMEGELRDMNGVEMLRSDWKLMPLQYEPPKLKARHLSHDEVQQMFHEESLHPWEQGVRFFPQGHPLYDAETQALKQQGLLKEDDETKEIGAGGEPSGEHA